MIKKVGHKAHLNNASAQYYGISDDVEFEVVWVRQNHQDESATLYGLRSARGIEMKVFHSEVVDVQS